MQTAKVEVTVALICHLVAKVVPAIYNSFPRYYELQNKRISNQTNKQTPQKSQINTENQYVIANFIVVVIFFRAIYSDQGFPSHNCSQFLWHLPPNQSRGLSFALLTIW